MVVTQTKALLWLEQSVAQVYFFGSVVIYEQGGTANIDAVFDSSNNKVVIAYQDNGDSGRGKAIVGTVDSSDTSISFLAQLQFNSGANNAYNVSAAFDSSNNKVVVAYRDNGNLIMERCCRYS